MPSDATEAALGLLGLSEPATKPTIPLKRPAPTDHNVPNNPDSISCICGFTYDDGFSIACDVCSRWCHAACFSIVEGEVPEEWRCWVCLPRPVDAERAIALQRQRASKSSDAQRKRRQSSPGVDRRHRRQSAPAIEGSHPKRKRRASASVPQVAEDEVVDIDEPRNHTYVHITKDDIPSQDLRSRLQRQAQRWRGMSALSSTPPPPSSPFDQSPVQLSSAPARSQTTLHSLSHASLSHSIFAPHTNSFVRPPSYSVHTAHHVPSARFITPFTSTIVPSSAYLSNPLNAYASHGMPKPFVHLFGPPLDVALDARVNGNEARFVRNGCRPNAVLRPVICPESKEEHPSDSEHGITFGIFALRDLKANEEVVLGWEWDDGNAIHKLPALIESPHLFAPNQVDHLRNQMNSMLHALSSTFTTCACGSKSDQCVLNLMAAFVDGKLPPRPSSPSSPATKVDLGPLVGAERGFRTREKDPKSGGMGGVEVVTPASTSSVLNDIVNGPSSSQFRPTKPIPTSFVRRQSATEVGPDFPSSMKKDRKGKGKALPNGADDHDPGSSSVKPQRRVTIDTPSRHRSPQPAVSDSDEEKMPPKLRRRAMHNAGALRATSMSASPSGSSTVSLGSALGPGDGEQMDVDHVPPEFTNMPPPPMPASLDPTTISSRPKPSPSSPQISTIKLPPPPTFADLHSSPSPSTPFSKLSLQSPIQDPTDRTMDKQLYTSLFRRQPPSTSKLSSPPHSLPTPLETSAPSSNDAMDVDTDSMHLDGPPAQSATTAQESSCRSSSPQSLASTTPIRRKSMPPPAPEEPTPSPPPASLSPSSHHSSLPPTTKSPPLPSESPPLAPPNPVPQDRTPPPTTERTPQPLPAESGLTLAPVERAATPPTAGESMPVAVARDPTPVVEREPTPQPVERTPTPPPAERVPTPPPPVERVPTPPPPVERVPTPPPKVKVSLKDFALRKKKQREEEQATAKMNPPPPPPPPPVTAPAVTNGVLATTSRKQNQLNGTSSLETGAAATSGLRSAPPASKAPKPNGTATVTNRKTKTDALPATNGSLPSPIEQAKEPPEREPSPPPMDYTSLLPPETNGSQEDGRGSGKPASPQWTPLSPSPQPPSSPYPEDPAPADEPDPMDLTPLSEPQPTTAPNPSDRSQTPAAKEEPMDDAVPTSVVTATDDKRRPSPRPSPRTPSPFKGESMRFDRIPTGPSGRRSSSDTVVRRPSRPHSPPNQPRSFSTTTSNSSTPSPVPQIHRLPVPSQRPPAPAFLPPPGRPVPSGPRALRVLGASAGNAGFAPARPIAAGGQYIPRGPSADRERKDWEKEREREREKAWVGVPRGPGRGAAGNWGR